MKTTLTVVALALALTAWSPAQAGPCKSDGTTCVTNKSCCGTTGNNGVCVKDPGKKFGVCATPCTEGAFRCDGTGFDTCSGGTWVYRDCAPGTACVETGPSTIVCDFVM